MPINIGTTGTSAIWVGDQAVSNVYAGTDLVWTAAPSGIIDTSSATSLLSVSRFTYDGATYAMNLFRNTIGSSPLVYEWGLSQNADSVIAIYADGANHATDSPLVVLQGGTVRTGAGGWSPPGIVTTQQSGEFQAAVDAFNLINDNVSLVMQSTILYWVPDANLEIWEGTTQIPRVTILAGATPTQGGGLVGVDGSVSYFGTRLLTPAFGPVANDLSNRLPGYGGPQPGTVDGIIFDTPNYPGTSNLPTWSSDPVNSFIDRMQPAMPAGPDQNFGGTEGFSTQRNFNAVTSGVYAVTVTGNGADTKTGFYEYVTAIPGVTTYSTNLTIVRSGWQYQHATVYAPDPTMFPDQLDTSFILGPNTENTSSDVMLILSSNSLRDLTKWSVTVPAGMDAGFTSGLVTQSFIGADTWILRGVPSVLGATATVTMTYTP